MLTTVEKRLGPGHVDSDPLGSCIPDGDFIEEIHAPILRCHVSTLAFGSPEPTCKAAGDCGGRSCPVPVQNDNSAHCPGPRKCSQVPSLEWYLLTYPTARVYLLTYPIARVYLLTYPIARVYLLTYPIARAYLLTHPIARVYLLTYPIARVYLLTYPIARVYLLTYPIADCLGLPADWDLCIASALMRAFVSMKLTLLACCSPLAPSFSKMFAC